MARSVLHERVFQVRLNIIGGFLYWIMLIALFLYMISLRQQDQVSSGDVVFVMGITLRMSYDLWQMINKIFITSDMLQVVKDRVYVKGNERTTSYIEILADFECPPVTSEWRDDLFLLLRAILNG